MKLESHHSRFLELSHSSHHCTSPKWPTCQISRRNRVNLKLEINNSLLKFLRLKHSWRESAIPISKFRNPSYWIMLQSTMHNLCLMCNTKSAATNEDKMFIFWFLLCYCLIVFYLKSKQRNFPNYCKSQYLSFFFHSILEVIFDYFGTFTSKIQMSFEI